MRTPIYQIIQVSIFNFLFFKPSYIINLVMIQNDILQGGLEMRGKYTTEYGDIVVENNVIAKVAGLSALECVGIVGMAALSKRDGLVKLLMRNSIAKGIRVEVQNNDVFLEFHVIVAFGVSIRTISDNLMDAVRYQVEHLTGFKVKKVSMIVEGVRVID